MSEIIGKIEWLADQPKEYPAGTGDFNIGMKVKGAFYNYYKPVEELKKILLTLKKGFEVKLEVTGNKIDKFEITNAVVDEKDKSFADDLTTFEDLLSDAHTKFKDCISIKTEMIENDWEKQRVIFKAKVEIFANEDQYQKYQIGELSTETKNPVRLKLAEFEAYGDATQDNCGDMVKKHYIRMAETRAIARALRWTTNNAKAAEEETEKGELDKDQEMSQEEMQEAMEEQVAENP